MSEVEILADSSGIDFLSTLPIGWNVKALGAVCEPDGGVQTGPFGSQLHAADYVAEGIPNIMPVNIGDNRIVEEGIARIKPDDAKRLSKYLVAKGDIVYSRRGDVERRALVTDKEDGWLCGTGCLRVRLQTSVNSVYASYYLGHPEVKAWIVRHAQGATMPNLNTSILSQLPFAVPPRDAQDAIAHFLASVDAKVDVLRKQNQTLEAMARAIFKSWFVDFDPVRAKAEGRTPEGMDAPTAALFPSTFTDSPLGPIPEGWNTLPVIDWASYVNGAAYKDMHFSDDPEALPVIKIAELKYGISPQTKYTATQLGEQYRIGSGDMLFSWSGSPDTSIDTFLWAGGDGWLNQHIFKVIPREQHERTFLYSMLKYLKPVFIEIARDKQTSGLGHVTRKDLQRLQFVEPPEPLIKALDCAVGPMVEKYEANLQTVQTLSELRDTLLPRLISGKLRLTDAQALTEDAA